MRLIPRPFLNWVNGVVTEINFDTVATGAVVNNKYGGVTLNAVQLLNQSPGANFGTVYASDRYDVRSADTPRNVITINKPPQLAGFDETGGGIQVTFSSPQLYVSIDAHPIITGGDPRNPNTNRPYMMVFGVPIKLIPLAQLPPVQIATVSLPTLSMNPNHFETWQTLDFVSTSATPNIGSIIFSSSNSGYCASVYALFDRLRFAHHLPLTATLKEG
jgi:hypothetical protein